MSTHTTIALFPLSVVLYPQGLLPLKIFEQRYMEMTKVCIRDDIPFGVCLIRAGHEVGETALPYESGCTARILQWDMPQVGMFHLRTQGEQRFRIIKQWTDSFGLLHGEVELTPPPSMVAIPTQHQKLVKLLQNVMPKVGLEHFPVPPQLEDAAWVGYRLLEVLPFTNPVKQQLLEHDDPVARLKFIGEFLEANQIVL
jgi:Lon protease-like protein